MSSPSSNSKSALEWTLEMVRIPSVTGSSAEGQFAALMREKLARVPYFRDHPEDVWCVKTENDPLERENLFALVRGQGSRTVILAGHFDVVSTASYGPLEPLAFEPEKLLEALLETLRGSPNPADLQALEDFESGAFLPGRGILDMKSGLASGIVALERFSQLVGRVGNLLLVATPDEEHGSKGMRSAISSLARLQQRESLEFVAALNLDATADGEDGSSGRTVYTGSVGKLLPTVLFIGRPTHAGYPFDGVNPHLMAAEFTLEVESNPAYSSVADAKGLAGTLAPAPTCLEQADFRAGYEVTTPRLTWVAFNVMLVKNEAAGVLARFKKAAGEALKRALTLEQSRFDEFETRAGRPQRTLPYQARLLEYGDLEKLALEHSGAAAVQDAKTRAETGNLDPLVYARTLTLELAQLANLSGPAAVVGFAPVYYPVALLGQDAKSEHLLEVCRIVAPNIEREFGQSIGFRPFFEGISDMSFLAPLESASNEGADDASTLSQNMPGWGMRWNVDYAGAKLLNVPVVNVGPWGREYHQRLERVHSDYAFRVLPELVWRLTLGALEEKLGKSSTQNTPNKVWGV